MRKNINANQQYKHQNKRLSLFLNKLLLIYRNFRRMQADKNSQEIDKAYKELNAKWIEACNKKWTRVIPDKELFAKQVDLLIAQEIKIEEPLNQQS